MDFRLCRRKLGQDAAQTERLVAKRRSDPIVARRRGIPFVEDQIDHLKDRGEARNALCVTRDLEPDVRLGESALRADDPLGDGRGRDEKAPRDLLRRQPAEDAECERDPGFL